MSNKQECPGCESYSSSVLAAFERGEPCPYCGLSAAAALEIEAVKTSRADGALRERLAVVLRERDEMKRELDRSRSQLQRARSILNEEAHP